MSTQDKSGGRRVVVFFSLFFLFAYKICVKQVQAVHCVSTRTPKEQIEIHTRIYPKIYTAEYSLSEYPEYLRDYSHVLIASLLNTPLTHLLIFHLFSGRSSFKVRVRTLSQIYTINASFLWGKKNREKKKVRHTTHTQTHTLRCAAPLRRDL